MSPHRSSKSVTGVSAMRVILTAVVFLAFAGPSFADIEIRVSIKVILGPGGVWPDNTNTVGATGVNLNSETAIRNNIALANRILARHAIGYRLVLRENTVYTLAGFDNFWFTSDARSQAFRDSVEDTATAAPAIWQWHGDAINFYLNDSRSGYCSFPGENRSVITIGAGAYDEMILHEIGHFFDLPHTHGAAGNWQDGDGFADTLDDDSGASAADINARYDGDPQPFQPQEIRNDLIFNIMSYHLPQNRFTWLQRERFIDTMNGVRSAAALGRVRYTEADGNNFLNGLSVAARVATIGRALQLSTLPNDVVLIRGGIYSAAAQGVPTTLSQPVTLSARRGSVTIAP